MLNNRDMTQEEYKEAILDLTSDAVRELARKVAMLKAVAHVDSDIDPADFDKVWEKELDKEWRRVKDKTSRELVAMAMLDMMSHGVDIGQMFEGDE